MPPPLLDVDALNDGDTCTLTRTRDGAVFRLPIPIRDFEAEPGTWTVAYAPERYCAFPPLTRSVEIPPGTPRVRVNLLTASSKREDTGLRRRVDPGSDDAWLNVRPLSAGAAITVDGRPVEPRDEVGSASPRAAGASKRALRTAARRFRKWTSARGRPPRSRCSPTRSACVPATT
jgi:hypothetical protein